MLGPCSLGLHSTASSNSVTSRFSSFRAVELLPIDLGYISPSVLLICSTIPLTDTSAGKFLKFIPFRGRLQYWSFPALLCSHQLCRELIQFFRCVTIITHFFFTSIDWSYQFTGKPFVLDAFLVVLFNPSASCLWYMPWSVFWLYI